MTEQISTTSTKNNHRTELYASGGFYSQLDSEDSDLELYDRANFYHIQQKQSPDTTKIHRIPTKSNRKPPT
jgi:hypothetical protein